MPLFFPSDSRSLRVPGGSQARDLSMASTERLQGVLSAMAFHEKAGPGQVEACGRAWSYPHDVAPSLQWTQSAGMLPEGPAPVVWVYIAYEEYEPRVYITEYVLQA